MKKNYRLIAMAVMMLFLFSFVACSNSETNTTQPSQSADVQTAAEETTAPVANADTNTTGSKDLVATLALIPGLVESEDKGTFVDFTKALDEVYTEGKIKIEVYPYARSVENVISGKADLHIPNMRTSLVDSSQLKYTFAKKAFGQFAMVIYSNSENKITKEMIDEAMKKGKDAFPYKIEVSGGLENNLPFPAAGTSDYKQSFQKLASKRIDAIINAQEESDLVLKELKLKNVSRSLFGYFEDVLTVAKNAHGEEMDKLLSDLVTRLEASGKLKEIYEKVHKPYEDWQPAQMGW
ncbi:MAG: transporter substrate-binding domain-containing protein [Clostridia bacterium]|nr:transporter substrate-binding domain-containing protein [Clostridia bacterium]